MGGDLQWCSEQRTGRLGWIDHQSHPSLAISKLVGEVDSRWSSYSRDQVYQVGYSRDELEYRNAQAQLITRLSHINDEQGLKTRFPDKSAEITRPPRPFPAARTTVRSL